MDEHNIKLYEEQLKQVGLALKAAPEGPQKEELLTLKQTIEELLSLSGNGEQISENSTSSDNFDDEYAAFMSEINEISPNQTTKPKIDVKNLEGTKCRAPHKHQWGDIVYHNAMICSISESSDNDVEVRVLFTNPTHQEMLPCPYFLGSDCKFSEEKCRFSHGETVLLSALQDFIEPKFEQLTIGSRVLAKAENNLWSNAVVRKMYNDKCLVQLEANRKDLELELGHIFPLNELGHLESESSDGDDDDEEERDDVINMSLMTTPCGEALGDWEKYTKGLGSKMMEKMGYVIGTGLGKKSDGRIEPVSAVILPTGKSLDYCMNLRERSGGDENLFSVERKMKRLQKRQEMQNKKAYEREQNKTDVFQFINNTLSKPKQKNKGLQNEMKNGSNRELNVASLKNVENIRRVERDLEKIRESLGRNSDVTSQVHKHLKAKLQLKQCELQELKAENVNILNEQKRRDEKRKMSVF